MGTVSTCSPSCPASQWIATDPPFNIGLKYDLYDDRRDYTAYVKWTRTWVAEAARVLKHSGSIFVCIGDEFAAEVNVAMKDAGLQLKYNDKRAKSGGKIPDDVWTFSRVCGTFNERIVDENGSSHPCQMPLAVMDRISKCSTEPGDLVLDLFAGTGTTLEAADRLGRRFVGCNLSEKYVRVAASRCFGDSDRFIRLSDDTVVALPLAA